MNNTNKIDVSNNNKKKNKNVTLLTILTIIIILIIAIVGMAYAKFLAVSNGTLTAHVAEMICNMNVTACPSNDGNIINPYCTVVLNDYKSVDGDEKVTETSLNYTVSVSPKANGGLTTLPAYYWEDMDNNGAPVGNVSEPLTGSFEKNDKKTRTFKITFVNVGTADITAEINFDLVAIQQTND